MLANRTLLTASNLNNAYISKTDTNAQSINSTLTISGGSLVMKNSSISDNASSSYMQIDPQGNKVIVYDGVNNQRLDVYSSSGSESTYLTTVNGTKSIGIIDVSSAIDHLEIATNSRKTVLFGSNIESSGGVIQADNPLNIQATVYLGWLNNDPRIRIGGNGSGSTGTFRIQGTGDSDRFTVDNLGNIWNGGTAYTSGKLTASGGIGISGSNSLSFDTYGGGLNMTDTTWIRVTGSKSFYHPSGTLRTDGTLQVGSGSTLSVVNGGQFNYNSGKFTIDTTGTVTSVGPIILNTAKAQNTGIKIDGVTIDTVGSGGNLAVGGMNQLRFGTSTSWDYNQWAGIKYDSTGKVLWIGGPSSTQFSSNASPSQIQTIFDGLSGMGINMTPRTGVTLDVSGDIGIASGHSLWVGNNTTSGSVTRIHNNGTDAYIDYGTNLHIRNNSSADMLYLSSTGSIGIGTTSPVRKMDINGDIRFGNIYSPNSYVGFLTDSGGALPTKMGSLAITSSYSNSAPTNGLYVQGSAGIGTSTPLRILDVNGDIRILNNIYSPTVTNLYTDTGTAQGMRIGSLAVTASYSNNAPTNGIYTDGKVGVGMNPTNQLDVAGTIGTTGTFISNSTSSDVFQAMGTSGTKTFRWEGGNLRFYTSQNSVLEAMTLSSGGNIGINQSNPAYKLDVNGNMNVTGLLYSLGDNQANFQIGNDSQLWDVNVPNTVGIYGVQNTAVGALKLGSTGPTLYGTGNSLGLGTTTPSSLYILDTKGDIRIGSGNAIFSAYNNNYFIKDHANGNVTLSALGSHLYLGYQNTTSVYLSSALQTTSSVNIIGIDGTLYYKGTDTNSTYLRLDNTNAMTADLNVGSHNIKSVSTISGNYGTIAKSTDEWLRLNDDGSHTLGVYFGPSIVRTDGYFQIGANGASGQWDGTGMTFPLGTLIQATGKDSANNTVTKTVLEIQSATDTGNTGYGVVIGAGGLTIIGAGESAQTVKSGNGFDGSKEKMYVSSDNEIILLSNQQSGYDTTNVVTINNGDISVGDTNTQYANLYYRSPSTHSISTGGWYRIAQTISGSTSRAYGRFMVMDLSAGNHELIDFTAGVAFNKPESVNIHMLGRVKYGSQEILGAIRILTNSTYDPSYLEVYCISGCVVQQIAEYYDQFWSGGWQTVDFTLTSSVPTGYNATNKMELQDGYYRNQNVLTGTTAPPNQGAYPGDVYIQY